MKLLVANRSEIACRIFQACREMQIIPVALEVPGDEEARHLIYADETVQVPNYLDAAAIVSAAQAAGVDLIHPGYGFLSERPHFADAVEKAGIKFVGPRAESMQLLGDKIAAKILAEKYDVPTLPWAKLSTDIKGAELKKAADKVGYPILLKAAAGGGGKGMRIVNRASELDSAAESASREALSAFGEGTLFLERMAHHPRHIEVQVFGDGEGGGFTLQERECSLQRRHQKVWEEAPAPHFSSSAREKILESALQLVRATRYRGAGTVEFLYDGKSHYFLEMNTRLQVEHPVTEWITGMDLVHAQIQLALGKKVQAPTWPSRGHSIEVRIYAEDPAQGYIPTTGTLSRLQWPAGPGIRVDSGIEAGQKLLSTFDPMLAKISVWAEDRDRALARLIYALEHTVILGAGNNINFLLALARDAQVVAGKMHIHYLQESFKNQSLEPGDTDLSLLSAAYDSGLDRRRNTAQPIRGSAATSEAWPSPWFSAGANK